MSGVELMLPPGFRFHPSDEELVTHYLCRRCAGLPISVPIIAEVDLYKYDPWQLPGMAQYGEKEWYFFSPRNRKYPNGSRPNRAAGSGYWKATGADKPIGSPKAVAIKKALVFYSGKAPKGVKTNWIMHEYRLAGVDRSVRKKNSLRMDDWVLCRLYHKKGGSESQMSNDQKPRQQEILWHEPKPKSNSRPPVPGMLCFDASDSPPRLRSDSSCGSAHVMSSEFTCDKEVESQLRRDGWENTLDLSLNNVDAAVEFPLLSPAFQDSLQDLFVYLQKPF